jgi:endonuclease IV
MQSQMKKYVVSMHMPMYIVMAESQEQAEEKALATLKQCVVNGTKIGCTIGGIDPEQFNHVFEADPLTPVICGIGDVVSHIEIGKL